jgi:RNA polymerase sigma-70 factor (ECF subfamily)
MRAREISMALEPSVKDAILTTIPQLRAFAMCLCKDASRVDDLVQETLVRALRNVDSFQAGTNMSAWLFTILRNHFISECRKERRYVEDGDGTWADSLMSAPSQHGELQIDELQAALDKLPVAEREAIILAAGAGFSYEEIARICGCPVGTIRSRISRGRSRLAGLLSIESLDDIGPDASTRAILLQRVAAAGPAG